MSFFWLFFFASINVNWTQSWIAKEFLPHSVAPHIAIAVPVIFILNVFELIPRFLNRKKWYYYIALTFTLLFGFEIIRAAIFALFFDPTDNFVDLFKAEFFGNNSLIFGALNVLTLNFIFYSFIYRFTRDWLINQSIIETLKLEKTLLENSKLQLVGANTCNSPIGFSENFIESNIKTTLSVKKKEGIFILKIDDIIYFQAQGDFVFAFDKYQKRHLLNESLKSIKSKIEPHNFLQINRSELLNFNYISKFNSYTKNRLEISLDNSNTKLFTSNSRTPEFRTWVEKQ